MKQTNTTKAIVQTAVVGRKIKQLQPSHYFSQKYKCDTMFCLLLNRCVFVGKVDIHSPLSVTQLCRYEKWTTK